MEKIRVGIVGMGNCACSLIQGIYYYEDKTLDECVGLMHFDMAGYKPYDIQVVSAFDIDKRKVNKDVSEAMFAEPNCTKIFCQYIPYMDVRVKMGRIFDGFSQHMKDLPEDKTFILSPFPESSEEDIVDELIRTKTEILINYLPVGSEEATKFYAECSLKSGCAFVNCIPVFVASNPLWAERFEEANLPIIGDDVKSQLGATITHRVLTNLFEKRGIKIKRTYQLNFGGNTDFLNMLNRSRLKSKKISKTEAVQSTLSKKLDEDNIHISPTDYVPWLKDNKVCYIRIEGKQFGDVPMELDLKLSVEDSPNSAGIVIDAIRCCKIALEKRIGGVLYSSSAYFMKHPPKQIPDDIAYNLVEEFIHSAFSTKDYKNI